MTHVVKVFWLFFFAAVLSGGLLGRYIAAFFQGHGSAGIATTSVLLALIFTFSVAVLVRVLRADARARLGLRERRRP